MKYLSLRRSITSSFIVCTSLFALVGCVNLDKPENVKRCASTAQGCSDNADAALTSDVASDVRGDLTEDRMPDLAADLPDASPDQSSPDVADVGTDSGKADRVSDDVKSFDTQTEDSVVVDLLASPDAELDAPAAEVARLDAEVLADGPSAPDLPPALDVTVDQIRVDVQTLTCMQQLIANNFQAPPAPACTACNDGNGNSLAKKCEDMITCLQPLGSGSVTYCLNKVSGSSIVSDCVTALTKAVCPNGF
jgi:hypothetical protein